MNEELEHHEELKAELYENADDDSETFRLYKLNGLKKSQLNDNLDSHLKASMIDSLIFNATQRESMGFGGMRKTNTTRKSNITSKA